MVTEHPDSFVKSEKQQNKNGDTRGLHVNSLKNLKPGNRLNAGKGPDVIDIIRRKLSEICQYDAAGRTWAEAEADAEMRQALTNPFARRDLLDRLYGSNTNLTGEITLKVVYDRSNERTSNPSA